MTSIPINLLVTIALKLDSTDLLNLCLTNARSQKICLSNNFWEKKFAKDFPKTYTNAENVDNWQEYYKRNRYVCHIIGCNLDGELGTNDETVQHHILLDVKSVLCLRKTTCIIDNDNKLFMCGLDLRDHYSDVRLYNPTFILGNVRHVAGSRKHIAIVTYNNELYTAGSNDYGELCDETTQSRCTVELVKKDVKNLACGQNFTMITTLNNDCYYYGHPLSPCVKTCLGPCLMAKNIIQMSCQENGLALIDNQKKLYILDPIQGDQKRCKPIFLADNVKFVAKDTDHTAFITQNNDLYALGRNLGGELGLGPTNDVDIPTFVMPNVKHVVCSQAYTALITTDDKLYISGYLYYSYLSTYLETNYITDYDQRHNVPQLITERVKSISCGYDHLAYIQLND